jgi:hypothetical protein
MEKVIEVYNIMKSVSLENIYQTKQETTIKFSKENVSYPSYSQANKEVSGWHALNKQETWVNGHALNILRLWDKMEAPSEEAIKHLVHTKDVSCFVWIFETRNVNSGKSSRYKVYHEIEYDIRKSEIIYEQHTISVEDKLFSEQWSICENPPKLTVW